MESHDVMMGPYCDDGTMPSDWPFKEWSDTMHEASVRAGRPLKIANKMKRWYIEAGFVDVQEKIIKIPINSWPRDRHLKSLGSHWAEDILAGLQAFSLALFSRIFMWNKTEIEVYLVNVRKAITNTRVHAYNKYYVVWGRKPEAPVLVFNSQNTSTPSYQSTAPHQSPASAAPPTDLLPRRPEDIPLPVSP